MSRKAHPASRSPASPARARDIPAPTRRGYGFRNVVAEPPSLSSPYEDISTADHQALCGFYILHEELGSGGFGKVKLATHVLSNLKVAIKIIDKGKIGQDLPRVQSELEALRELSHQHICRLYQHIETKEKVYIVMEYCAGGELFDYIVKKERLQESEARHFFRQLVQAMIYVHTMGYAHRDLKPENLLLTEDLQLKLIDFGLCAKSLHPGGRPSGRHREKLLHTCCGSVAYAAPELIECVPYYGSAADIWSMGVLLYALLCGCLPFDDADVNNVYEKIKRGDYYKPPYLSELSKDLLSKMLDINPRKRIRVLSLAAHPWVTDKYQGLKWQSVFNQDFVDEAVSQEMAIYFNRPVPDMQDTIREWRFDYVTTTYHLLLHQKCRGLQFALPVRRSNTGDKEADARNAVLSSPTIHASLNTGMDKAGTEDVGFIFQNDEENEETRAIADQLAKLCSPSGSHPDKNTSYARAMMNMSPIFAGRSPLQDRACTLAIGESANIFATPLKPRNVNQKASGFNKILYYRPGESSKENRPATVRARPTTAAYGFFDEDERISSPKSSVARSKSTGRGAVTPSPSTPDSGRHMRTPRSLTKSAGRLRQRLFASLERVERQADRMINMLTPRRVNKRGTPQIIKQGNGVVNVSITSSKDPDVVLAELIRVFNEHNLVLHQRGWKVCGRTSNNSMTVELEIIIVELGNKEHLVGVKRRRLHGNAFEYKKVCEEVLRLAGI